MLISETKIREERRELGFQSRKIRKEQFLSYQKVSINRRISSSPAKTQNSPLKGFFRKNKSKTAG